MVLIGQHPLIFELQLKILSVDADPFFGPRHQDHLDSHFLQLHQFRPFYGQATNKIELVHLKERVSGEPIDLYFLLRQSLLEPNLKDMSLVQHSQTLRKESFKERVHTYRVVSVFFDLYVKLDLFGCDWFHTYFIKVEILSNLYFLYSRYTFYF